LKAAGWLYGRRYLAINSRITTGALPVVAGTTLTSYVIIRPDGSCPTCETLRQVIDR